MAVIYFKICILKIIYQNQRRYKNKSRIVFKIKIEQV